MNILLRNSFKLWKPFLDVFAIRVVIELLGPRIKYPKVRLGISAIAHRPLPSATVLHCAEINQLASEVSFSFMPIQKQILGEKRSSDHSASIMHESCSVEFSHRSVYNGKSSLSCLPCLKVALIILPLHLIELWLEGIVLSIQYSRKVMTDINIKVSPMQLINEVVF